MRRRIEEKLRSIELRKKGYSLNEIVDKLGVAKGSVSVWVRNIPLDEKAKQRLLTKIKLGQLIAAENKRRKTQETLEGYRKKAVREVRKKDLDKTFKKIFCSFLYYCEGAKGFSGGVRFINSDPSLIENFIFLLRESFIIDEKKFRAGMHLYQYHNEDKQREYWSRITKIPKKQFIKSYLKPNTGKRIRENYPGCLTIYYHDNNLAREIISIYKAFSALLK